MTFVMEQVLTCDDLVLCIGTAALEVKGLVLWHKLRQCSVYLRELLDRKLPRILKGQTCLKLGGGLSQSKDHYRYESIQDMIKMLHENPRLHVEVRFREGDSDHTPVLYLLHSVLQHLDMWALDVINALGLVKYCKREFWSTLRSLNAEPGDKTNYLFPELTLFSMKCFHNPCIDTTRKDQLWKLHGELVQDKFTAFSRPQFLYDPITAFEVIIRWYNGLSVEQFESHKGMQSLIYVLYGSPVELRRFFTAESTPARVKAEIKSFITMDLLRATREFDILDRSVHTCDTFFFPCGNFPWYISYLIQIAKSGRVVRWAHVFKRHRHLFKEDPDWMGIDKAENAVELLLDAALALELEFQSKKTSTDEVSVSKSVLLLNAGARVYKPSYKKVMKVRLTDEENNSAAVEWWHSILHQPQYQKNMQHHQEPFPVEVEDFIEEVKTGKKPWDENSDSDDDVMLCNMDDVFK
jgi:hypothetical protein